MTVRPNLSVHTNIVGCSYLLYWGVHISRTRECTDGGHLREIFLVGQLASPDKKINNVNTINASLIKK